MADPIKVIYKSEKCARAFINLKGHQIAHIFEIEKKKFRENRELSPHTFEQIENTWTSRCGCANGLKV